MDFNNKQIFLLGPTATGKTELIKDLYKFFWDALLKTSEFKALKNEGPNIF